MTRSGNSAQQKALHLFSRGLEGREGPLMAEIYIFCFPIFFSNMSGISAIYTYDFSQRYIPTMINNGKTVHQIDVK